LFFALVAAVESRSPDHRRGKRSSRQPGDPLPWRSVSAGPSEAQIWPQCQG